MSVLALSELPSALLDEWERAEQFRRQQQHTLDCVLAAISAPAQEVTPSLTPSDTTLAAIVAADKARQSKI